VEVNGATRWIKVGPITFQPAEITKVAVILLLSGLISKMGKRMKGIAAPCIIIAIALVAAGCTYIFTENMSTAIIILGIAGIMLLIVHPTIQRLIPLGVVVAAAGIYGLRRYVTNNGVSGRFRLMRILVWIKPEEYSADGGYQIIQALYAIGSGGFFGKGLGNSTQKLVALPEAQNDMIFSIICEELGVFGAAMLIMLFMFLLYRLLENAPDLTGSLVVTGVFGHIALQVLLNIAVVINLIPTTGITLPLVSYGGTSVVFLMIELGLVANVASHIRVRSEATAPEIQEQRREQLREKREMEKVRHIR
jgi:cell division protein FtsW